ncbi:TVP38/TMEM64 family protein [Kaarinaea lacus]
MDKGLIKNLLNPAIKFWRPLLLLALVLLGIILYYLDVFDFNQVLNVAQNYAQHWWAATALIVIQALLFTFALPGSLLLWVVAVIYVPTTATIILVSGSTLGALGAYWFARWESVGWTAQIQQNRIFHVLEKRGDFLTLSTLRILPSFPHSVINYGAGILRLPLGQFIGSAIIGFTLKNFLYTNAIHGAVTAADPSDVIRLETIVPLIILALLFAIAAFFHSHWSRIHKGD